MSSYSAPIRDMQFVLKEMVDDSVEVPLNFRSKLNPRHRQRANFLLAGRAATRPAIRSSR